MPFPRRLAAAFAALAGFVTVAGAAAGLPPVSGELSGNATTAWLPGAPPVQWKLTLDRGARAGERLGYLDVAADGLRARIEVRAATAAELHWRVSEAELDVGRWLPLVAAKYVPQLSGVVVRGRVALSGEGMLRGEVLSGRARFELRDATLGDPAGAWEVSGVWLRGSFRALPTLETEGALTLTFAEATAPGVVARQGDIEFSIDAEQRVRVSRAKAAFMDGRIEIVPFEFDLRTPEILTDVLFERIELSRFASSLPALLSDARGPVSGKVAVSWSPAAGLKSATGSLRPDAPAPVLIALTPSPGLLTAKIPPRVGGFMPSWLGWLFPAKTPAYETLREIENGETRLEVTTIEIAVQPEGGPNGRSAQIVVNAGPAKHSTAVKSVRFEINVTGPLADFVKLLLEGNVKLHLR